ncbi:MAG TPA: FadR/GntR family transcriptional regulator [Acidimicrobiales bacterium]|nr:FadR/GntR family transcriptional regulator [Acidimicrobiales bacterium]
MTGLPAISPPSRSVLFEQVASQLEGLILAGKVAVGAKLPPEGALAAQFGVSRPVIREALAQLRDRGLTETINGSGTYARQPDSEHLTEVLLRHLHFGELAAPEVVESLYEARTAVEVMAARLAASRVLDADLHLISSRFEEMKTARHDPSAWIKADMGFHLAVVDAAHNPFLRAFLKPMTRIIEQSMSESWRDPKAVRAGLLAHQAICDAIIDHDEDMAAKAMLDHLEDSRARLSSALVLPSAPRPAATSNQVTSNRVPSNQVTSNQVTSNQVTSNQVEVGS